MKFEVTNNFSVEQQADCLVVRVFEKKELSGELKEIDLKSEGFISKIFSSDDFTGEFGEILLLHQVPNIPTSRVLLVGCGNPESLDTQRYQKLLTAAASYLQKTKIKKAVNYLTMLPVIERDEVWVVRQAVLMTSCRLHQSKVFKTDAEQKKKKLSLNSMRFVLDSKRLSRQLKHAVSEGEAIAKGVCYTRDLADQPANVCTPSYLASEARKLAKTSKGLAIDILEEAKMQALGMNVLLSVSAGSEQAAKLIVFKYQGAKNKEKPIVLIGKGVTFDTGGISLKPSSAMDEMKYDMCGAATVFGTMMAVSELSLPVNLVGIVPATENMPGGRATKPGDIFKSMSGQTVEVLNTDAEGRLILADSLTYSKRFKPHVVIDIATLTGACVVALGKHASGLMGNDETLVNDLLNAGQYAGDRAWQLPIWEEYQEQLKSPFADLPNISSGRDAGTITAACFLSRFAESFSWAHLDIAGTAWLDGKNKGATGRPVSLLMHYILQGIQ